MSGKICRRKHIDKGKARRKKKARQTRRGIGPTTQNLSKPTKNDETLADELEVGILEARRYGERRRRTVSSETREEGEEREQMRIAHHGMRRGELRFLVVL